MNRQLEDGDVIELYLVSKKGNFWISSSILNKEQADLILKDDLDFTGSGEVIHRQNWKSILIAYVYGNYILCLDGQFVRKNRKVM